MELGEKLRQARQDAGLSQRQLCGGEITRNMLSQIESGKARPSMDTLCYLAARLGRPVSWFLEEGAVSPNQALIARAREAYRAGAYRQVTEELADYKAPDALLDEEKELLLALALTELARQAEAQGRLPYARELLHRAGQCQSSYWTEALERERQVLLALSGGEVSLCADERVLMLLAKKALAEKDWDRGIRLLEAVEDRQGSWQLLRGRAALEKGELAMAAEFLTKAEDAGLREVLPDLEACYRRMDDYKMAYTYACKQRL